MDSDILFSISSAITISGGLFINNLFDYIALPNLYINFRYDIFNFSFFFLFFLFFHEKTEKNKKNKAYYLVI